MILFESLLQRTQRAVIRQTFNGNDRCLVRLNSEHQARAHRRAIIEHGAAAADTVLATDMGAGEIQILAQKVGEAFARLYCFFNGLAVDRKFDSPQFHLSSRGALFPRLLLEPFALRLWRGSDGMIRWRGYP